jgi:hypothetical protein
MTAIPLFSKSFSVNSVAPQSDAQQLQQWLNRGRNEVFTVQTMLTPDLARLLLASNEENRHIRERSGSRRNVAAYAEMMQRGEWQLNGSTIVVASNGQLNDGQHRCAACVKADVPVPVLITFGVHRETRTTLDQGAARSPGDVLKFLDPTISEVNNVSGFLQMRFALAAGRAVGSLMTPDELRDGLQLFPEYAAHIQRVRQYARRMHLSVGVIAAAHSLCAEANCAKANEFWEAVATGVGIASVNSPVARLRDLYDKNKGVRGNDLSRETQAALYVKGFNNFARGRTGPLTFRPKGAPEPFPVAVRG